MKLFSTNNRSHIVDLKEAVMNALPPDRGLYMPVSLEQMPSSFWSALESLSFSELSFAISRHLLSEAVPDEHLKLMVDQAIDFPAPVIKLSDQIHALELFHGPSLAFKDFGARFMAQLMSFFNRGEERPLTILVATSGDTGGAVAAGFHNAPGIEVVILYPEGRVSDLQEKQLTTLGGNISACEIKGSFDDCQSMVKEAFLDTDLSSYRFSSANSINIARLIPQSFYYVEAFKQLDRKENVVFSVPSGNFGNLTAGLIAKKLGLPVQRFIAATNINDIVPNYLLSGVFQPKDSIPSLSNAMDVGNPSNFARMMALYSSTWNTIAQDVWGYRCTDQETKEAIQQAFQNHQYICDPHGAIGFASSEAYLSQVDSEAMMVFLETAHPAKFLPVMEGCLNQPFDIPKRLAMLSTRQKQATALSNDYLAFKEYLLSR